MKPKRKKEIKHRKVAPRRGTGKRARSKSDLLARKLQFAKLIWPGIKGSTKFVELPEFQGTVTYTQHSGDVYTAWLKWYSISRGSRIFGHYDDENDVCYVGKFVE